MSESKAAVIKEHIYISFSSFGKTVFLTNDKAERVLKEREQV